MRGRTEFGGKATPGAMPASMMNSRPFSGSRTTCSFSTTVPRLAVSARTIGASPTTVTCSRTSPTLRSKSMRAFSPVARRTPSRRTGLNPGELDVEAVVAGRQARGGIDAIATGDGDSLKIRPCVGDRDRRAGNSRPGLIFHDAGDLARTRLSTGWQHADKPRARHRKADRTQSPSIHTDDVLGQVGPCFSPAPDLGPLRPKMTNRTHLQPVRRQLRRQL